MLVPLKVNFQHVPQFAELKPGITPAPPMLGKVGKDLKVVNPALSPSRSLVIGCKVDGVRTFREHTVRSIGAGDGGQGACGIVVGLVEGD